MHPIESSSSSILLELLDNVDIIVLILDTELRIVAASRGAANLLCYSKSELVARSLLTLIEGGEREGMARIAREAHGRQQGEAVFLTRSLEKRPVSFSLGPLSGAPDKGDGEALGSLLIGSHSAAESSSSEVDASNGLARRMLSGFADPLMIVDGPSRKVQDCNEAALAAFGFSREELIGRRVLDHVTSEEERRRQRDIETRADRNYATAGIFQERILYPRKKAAPLPCDLTGLPFFHPDGSLASIIVMLFDRSEEEEREAELSRLADEVNALAGELAFATKSRQTTARRAHLSELGFTSRQIEIARCVAEGASSKEIGFRLGISVSTVKNHLAVMYRKLGANSRIGFIRQLSERRLKLE